jgi:transcriptional regulator with PAS, ATPase and Fis domain
VVIPAELISSRIRESVVSIGHSLLPVKASGKLHHAVDQLEREMIHQGLLRTNHNKSRLARELGISRSNLILKIAKYGLEQPAGATTADDDVGTDEIEPEEISGS